MTLDKNTVGLLAGACYVLGFVGTFIAYVMGSFGVGSAESLLGEAFMTALIWPVEVARLLLSLVGL